MYLDEIASTCPLTSRANAFSCSSRSELSCASTSRSKLSSGNLASIGASRSTRITASTRSPLLNPYCSEYASGGRRSRNKLPSSSSPKPPRAFGGRRTCCSWPSSFGVLSEEGCRPADVPELLVDCVRLLRGVLHPPVDLRVELAEAAVHGSR
jgi:hypothetical protein